MNTLALHIENLLLENDCVIVPGFGGFVAHYTSAKWCNEEESFLPPCRIIGFNPQLVINDGVLVQSYMKVYDASFPDATKIVEKEVAELLRTLQEEGKLELPNIGEIFYSIDSSYTFEPYNNRLVSPSFYGLSSFEMKELRHLKQIAVPAANINLSPKNPVSGKHYEIRINRVWLRSGVAAAIAFIMFFSFSTPVENTYVAQENYAQLLPSDIFKKIEKESLLTTMVENSEAETTAATIETEIIPVVIVETTPIVVEEESDNAAENMVELLTLPEKEIIEVVSPVSPSTEVVTVADRSYHIIVASVLKQEDAEKIADDWRLKGHQEAQVISRDGRIRVSIMSYANRAEGENKMLQLRQDEMYKNTWLLPVIK